MFSLLASVAIAGPPSLHPPVDGALGVDVWISSRPDVDSGPGFRDHAGGDHTYDGHKGTDFAVAGSQQASSTWVRAPTAGTVVRSRDGVPDGQLLHGGRAAVGADECGNGLAIDVGDGWEIQLCHLALGTLQVKPGDRVTRGANLARVGWSGTADHPHVHLSVRHQGRVVDPFSGRRLDDGTSAAPTPLWATPLGAPSDQDALAWIGFRPGPEDGGIPWPVDTGQAVVPASASSLVLEVFLWRPEQGDVVQTALTAPDGTVTRGQVRQELDRPRQVWRIRKEWPATDRPTGLWTAEVTWKRGTRTRTLHTTTVLR